MPSSMILSCPVDYPYGLSNTKVRQHQTLSMIKHGARAIDLILNPVYILNNKRSCLINDIKANRLICNENNVIFRVMLEYRHFDEEVYAEMVKICKILRLPYIFPSTGHFADDYVDNLIICKMIQSEYPDAKIITNGNIWEKEHYDIIEKSNIYGVRLRSGYDIRVLENSQFGV